MRLIGSSEVSTAVLAPPARRGVGRVRFSTRSLRLARRSWQLYVMLALPLLWLLLFQYWPMYGVQIAFRNFNVIDGITGSPWVGLENFQRFVSSYNFWQIIRNTVILSVYSLVAGFPLPIRWRWRSTISAVSVFKRTVQMVGYAPEFISTVVMVGIIFMLLDPELGWSTRYSACSGIGPIDFMGDAGLLPASSTSGRASGSTSGSPASSTSPR